MPRFASSIPPYINNDDRPKALIMLKNNKPKANEAEIRINLNKFDLKKFLNKYAKIKIGIKTIDALWVSIDKNKKNKKNIFLFFRKNIRASEKNIIERYCFKTWLVKVKEIAIRKVHKIAKILS